MSDHPKIEGFELADPSDCETCFTGCWDKDHDPEGDHEIPEGEPVYWRCGSIMYQQYDPHCAACAASYYDTI